MQLFINYMMFHSNSEPERECLQCGKELSGRRDQKYCNDTCRNLAGRLRLRRERWNEPDFIVKIQSILKRNYRIIENELLFEKPRKVSRSLLLDKGFDFRFHTSIIQTNSGIYYFCYRYGWRALEDGRVLLVENDQQAQV